jgi:hypothetical protein
VNSGWIIGNTVFTHWVEHHVEHDIFLYQFIDEMPRILRVYVIIISAMDQQ